MRYIADRKGFIIEAENHIEEALLDFMAHHAYYLSSVCWKDSICKSIRFDIKPEKKEQST